VVPLSGSTEINGTGMNGAVAGFNQVAGVSHRFRSEPNAATGAVLGAVAGAGAGAGASASVASAEESGSGHAGLASRMARTLQNRIDANAACRAQLGLRIRARRMFKTFSVSHELPSVRGGGAAG
jgi:hypothetical protein